MSTMTAEQTKIIGRADYGTEQTVTLITIEGTEFYVNARGEVLEPCGRCYEAGSIRAFSHVLNGVCFRCTGRGWTKNHGTVEQATKVMQRRAKDDARRNAAADAAAEKFMAERDARYAAWVAANPTVAAALAARYEAVVEVADDENAYYDAISDLNRDERTLTDLATDARTHGGLSDAQVALATKVLARIEAKAEQAAASVYIGTEGEKVTVSGTVTLAKSFESGYGYRTFNKMIVKVEDGNGGVAVMFTTAQWAFEVEQGDAITVTGTVDKHEERDGVRQTVLARPKAVKG